MKKILIISSMIIFVLFAVLISVPFWVDVNKYKDQIVSLVKAKSGRDINVAGEITLNVIPNISLTLNDASLASPIKDEGNIFTTSKFILKVKIMPLFKKNLEIDSFKLVDPKFNLHILANGKNNWIEAKPIHIEDTTAVEPKATATETHKEISDVGAEIGKNGVAPDQPVDIVQSDDDSVFDGQIVEPDQSKLSNLIFNNIQIVNGSLSFIDDQNSRNIQISNINLNTSLKPGGNPFELAGKLDIFEDKSKGVFKITGQYFVGDSQYGLDGVTVNFDGIEAFINALADMETYKPTFKMSLYVGNINLNDYKISTVDAGASGAQASDNKAFTWSAEPIDFNFIHKIDLNLNFKTSGVRYQDLSSGEIMLNAYIRNNQLILNMKDSKIFDGNINGDVTVDSGAGNNTIKSNLKIEHLDFAQLPKKFERINLAGGVANTEVKLNSSGNNQKSIIGNLGGTANVNMVNISLEGVDIFSMVNNVVSAFDIGHLTNKTVFKEISGDFNIKQGVISNDNCVLKSDVLNLAGSGTINLNDLTINYKLTPKYSQEAENADKGPAVPVVITGNLMNPQFKLEVNSLVKDLINNPKGPENLVKQLKRDLKDAKENIKGGDVINDLKGMFK
jgi:AsmA protein